MEEYYPPLTDIADMRLVPCFKCGAMVQQVLRGLHVDWHERQKSTERLILDNQPPRPRELEHATDCTCRDTIQYGYVIGPSCIRKWYLPALDAMNKMPGGGPHEREEVQGD